MYHLLPGHLLRAQNLRVWECNPGKNTIKLNKSLVTGKYLIIQQLMELMERNIEILTESNKMFDALKSR